MRAIIVGAGMGGLFSALSLRESGVFSAIDVYEQTRTPSTAGAGLNIAPNGARLCKWLGVDLDGEIRKDRTVRSTVDARRS